jgi:hypothetical protein
VIGAAGASISYIRRHSGAAVTIQESRGAPGEMTVEIIGSAAQVQTAQQLVQVYFLPYLLTCCILALMFAKVVHDWCMMHFIYFDISTISYFYSILEVIQLNAPYMSVVVHHKAHSW